jgi:predicted GIY-YIG superfamily endonuclease
VITAGNNCLIVCWWRLESLTGSHHYTGITDDLVARLAKHNSGAVPHTSKFSPWQIKTYIDFADQARSHL